MAAGTLVGDADGRLIERNVRYDDAIAQAARIHEVTGESCTFTDAETGEKTVLNEAVAAGWPSTHAELDELGEDNGVEFAPKAKVADKIAALTAAGVEPPADED